MGKKPCPECKALIDENSDICPSCGALAPFLSTLVERTPEEAATDAGSLFSEKIKPHAAALLPWDEEETSAGTLSPPIPVAQVAPPVRTIAAQPQAPAPVSSLGAAIPVTPLGSLPIEILTPAGSSVLILSGTLTVGRQGANLVVEHPSLLPVHCKLEMVGAAWKVSDSVGKETQGALYSSGRKVSTQFLAEGELIDLLPQPGVISIALPGVLKTPVPLHVYLMDQPANAVELTRLPLTIGRANWVDLPLQDVGISSLHARFRKVRGQVAIEDLQSRNGTYINGNRLVGVHILNQGDRIQMGSVTLVFGSSMHVIATKPASSSHQTVVMAPPASGQIFEQPAPPSGAGLKAAPSSKAAAQAVFSTVASSKQMQDDISTSTPGVKSVSGVKPSPLQNAPHLHQAMPAPQKKSPTKERSSPRCPSCKNKLVLSKSGVITGMFRLVRTASGATRPEGIGATGRCSCCGVRLSACPSCSTPNLVPSLFDPLECSGCQEVFRAQ